MRLNKPKFWDKNYHTLYSIILASFVRLSNNNNAKEDFFKIKKISNTNNLYR